VGDQLQPVLTGEGRVVELLGRQVETDRGNCTPLQPENPARPQLDVDAPGVGSRTVRQRCRMRFALCAAIPVQCVQVAFESQREGRTIEEEALCTRDGGGT